MKFNGCAFFADRLSTSLVPYGYPSQFAAIENEGKVCFVCAGNTSFNFWTSTLDTRDTRLAVATARVERARPIHVRNSCPSSSPSQKLVLPNTPGRCSLLCLLERVEAHSLYLLVLFVSST
jgi:hypothetical protein